MKQCLLLVDFQREMAIPDEDVIVANMKKAISIAKENNVHCANLLFIGDKDSQLLKDWKRWQDYKITEANEESLLCECDEILTKSGYCMNESDAETLVNNFDRIFLVGCYLDSCELAVGLQLESLSKDCEIYCISELSCEMDTRSGENHGLGMSLLDWNIFGRVITFAQAAELFKESKKNNKIVFSAYCDTIDGKQTYKYEFNSPEDFLSKYFDPTSLPGLTSNDSIVDSTVTIGGEKEYVHDVMDIVIAVSELYWTHYEKK